ncbi:hypothetical protein BP6252_04535 [Coleophoma cylindrospora]|uniref:Uncharacterized protein n=1 Tax=Coleophoma cylindrospora TaxID=1849047 RepID=A0A3D8S0S0_9HELO|nr:hypothetical protein BP6252_04535 [Coleophoma cylindrospora]
MAFRQPTYHAAPQRNYADEDQLSTPAQTLEPAVDESQQWILFSGASVTDLTNTTSTGETCTAGRSRASDFGSLDTRARSYDYDDEAAVDEDESASTEELDSLDSHLHEFRTEPSIYNRRQSNSAGPVLPTHDGLGSFRVDQTTMGEEVQEHLYAFERYNPRRVKRRRESLELGALELAADQEKARMIEAWRMEQSRVLVEEIQKETRRRKQSMTSERVTLTDANAREQEDVATLSNVEASVHGQGDLDDEISGEEDEGFWNRMTRRVIRDLIGIDDRLLSIIFGESLPEDDDLSTTPPGNRSFDSSMVPSDGTWEHRLLERIARELGILVNQLSDHPGAFSTYLRTQQAPIPYAGLPAIPEAVRDPAPVREPSLEASLPTPQFQPTLPIPMQASFHSAPDEEPDNTPRASYTQTISREDWERDLDIKMVFRYLRSRFTSSNPAPLAHSTHSTAHLATASTADTAARAARVRAHHPLVSNRSPSRRETRVGLGMGVRRHSSASKSSCASVVSAKRSSMGGSSRHYWDIGGSIGSGGGSLIASTGAMGSWGEV